MTTDRIHFECVLTLPVGRRIIHEYAPGEAEAREQAWATVHQLDLEVLSIDLNVIPAPVRLPGSYLLECFSCGLEGTIDDFGLGNARQCPSCGSYEVHTPTTERTN